jgi:hypothetical protein
MKSSGHNAASRWPHHRFYRGLPDLDQGVGITAVRALLAKYIRWLRPSTLAPSRACPHPPLLPFPPLSAAARARPTRVSAEGRSSPWAREASGAAGPGVETMAQVASRHGGGADRGGPRRGCGGTAAPDAASPPSLPLSKRGSHTRCHCGRQASEATKSGEGALSPLLLPFPRGRCRRPSI